MRNPRPIWLTPNAGRLYSDVVSLFTMSIDPKIKTSNWTVKQQMLLNGQIVCFLNSLLYLKECSSVLVECKQTTATRRRLRANNLVGRGGLEPPTSRLSGVRSNHLSYRPILMEPIAPEACSPRIDMLQLGGAYRDRTDDPLLAKQVLSQLS